VVVVVVVVAAALVVIVAAAAALVVNHSCSHTGTFTGIQSSSKLLPLYNTSPHTTNVDCNVFCGNPSDTERFQPTCSPCLQGGMWASAATCIILLL